ncbi:hypothetical protein BGW36DRAFT_396134 [Talaromyces proteolyticus]|uniref:Cytochrome oxidase c assembly-domain-containing protein n=1 Tax=Talaromyces proteolyticus TaxID=1131652 RepID=A0AAD4KXH1_9EURO|nr:uncharacterized protein BGW36DRAFT_396134 [Talaromyces proteolyticus]KAH8698316.1 hypothetical protein BGW36DRAFT_396134 [Talaromyces proteolyticus]
MSRSAADATRFTATGPYVGPQAPYKMPDLKSKTNKQKPQPTPTSTSSSSSIGGAGGAGGGNGESVQGETPRQKVERLRAQARAARLNQNTSPVDRLIERGRRAANGAHKMIIYTLIAASGVCGALTLYSVVSLTMWNRRQRDLWLDRQLQDLQSARQAYIQGTATPEQLEILKNEKIGEIEKQKAEEAKEQRVWSKAKRFLFEGLNKGDDAAGASASTTEGARMGVIEALNAKKAEEEAAVAAMSSVSTTKVAGSLDILATNAETKAKQSAQSWSSWIWRRKD